MKECTLKDNELIEKCKKWVTILCTTEGRAWCLSVPANFNHDPDMLFSELIKRYVATTTTPREEE